VDAYCVLSLAQWACRHALPVPRLAAAHVAFVEGQHAKMAHQLLRKWRRVCALKEGGGGDTGDADTEGNRPAQDKEHVPQMICEERACAERLWRHFGGAVSIEEIKGRAALDAAVRALHGQPESPT
jgi:hypothetical protein